MGFVAYLNDWKEKRSCISCLINPHCHLCIDTCLSFPVYIFYDCYNLAGEKS